MPEFPITREALLAMAAGRGAREAILVDLRSLPDGSWYADESGAERRIEQDRIEQDRAEQDRIEQDRIEQAGRGQDRQAGR